ncbi:MAG TPA: hypothetical protein VG244_05700 [Acidimicrobiales bacterium]|jgi:hypothetical protein|nr:hypothetical protein [Acidimicrobiales bacterium]
MAKIPGAYDTEGDFPGWGEMAVIRGEMKGLKVLVEAQRHIHDFHENQLREFVFRLRYRHSPFDPPDGVTWAEIGKAFEISRQAAQQRFGVWVEKIQGEELSKYETGDEPWNGGDA